MNKKHFTASERKALETLWELDQLARQPNQQLLPRPTPKFSFIPFESFFIPFNDMISGPICQPKKNSSRERGRTFVFTGWVYPWQFVVKVYLRSNWLWGKKKHIKLDECTSWEPERVVIGWVEKIEKITKESHGTTVVELGRIIKQEQQIPWPPLDNEKKILTKENTVHHFDPPVLLEEYISRI